MVYVGSVYITAFGSTLTGGRQGVIEASLHVLLQAPDHVPEEQKFDLIVLVSTLCTVICNINIDNNFAPLYADNWIQWATCPPVPTPAASTFNILTSIKCYKNNEEIRI